MCVCLQAELSAGLYRGSWMRCACGRILISQSGRGLKGACLSVSSGWRPVNAWLVRCGNATLLTRGAERNTGHRGWRASPSDWRRSDRTPIKPCSISRCIILWCVCVCFRWRRCDLCVRNCSVCYPEGNSRFQPHVCISLSQDSTRYTTTLTLRYTHAQDIHYCVSIANTWWIFDISLSCIFMCVCV